MFYHLFIYKLYICVLIIYTNIEILEIHGGKETFLCFFLSTMDFTRLGLLTPLESSMPQRREAMNEG